MLYAYYHGCHGNIPPIPPIFVKNEIVQIKPIFFIIIFKARIKKKYQECYIKCFTHIIMVVMATHPHPHPNFCEK